MITASPDVGVVGLGLLGSAIVTRLLRHPLNVVGYDLDSGKRTTMAEQGVATTATADDVFEKCNLILLCLPTSTVVAEVLDKVAGVLRAGQTIIDTTTGDPEESKAIARRLQQRGGDYIEARICGSSDHVRRGDATLLLGGDETRIEQFNDVLDAISRRRFYLGEVGSASRFKLVHNLILGLNRAALAEGLQFARSLGFDAATALQILSQTPATSQAMEAKGRKMTCSDYVPQATLAQHLKDVTLILEESRKCGAITPLSELHQKVLEHAVLLGFGDADNCAIIEAFIGPPVGNGHPLGSTPTSAVVSPR